jgi:hypothetical protein
MADSNTIAILGISVAGATAILAPSITSWLEGRREERRIAHEADQNAKRFAFEREVRDTDKLRALMDEALVALNNLNAVFVGALETYLSDDQSVWKARFSDYHEAADEAARVKARLMIRLGAVSDVGVTYERCVAYFADASGMLAMDEGYRAFHGRDPDSAQVFEHGQLLQGVISEAGANQSDFVATANRLVGSAVPRC